MQLVLIPIPLVSGFLERTAAASAAITQLVRAFALLKIKDLMNIAAFASHSDDPDGLGIGNRLCLPPVLFGSVFE
jgi:hypothetical protein